MGSTKDERPAGEEKVRKYKVNKQKFASFILTLLLLIGMAAGALVLVSGYTQAKPASAPGNTPSPSGKVAGMEQKQTDVNGKLVVVDAGHGGMDPGASGVSGVHEDGLNLDVAKFLEADLKDAGCKVIMTRSDENAIAETKDADMAKRREIISESNSDIVISIHMNSYTDPDTSGPIAFFMQGSARGEKLAEAIQQRLNTQLKPKTQNGARANDFFILKSGNQPCVLVECGFITNPEEEALLKDSGYQKKLAQAICDAAVGFMSDGD